MEKLVYLVWGDGPADDALAGRLLGDVGPALLACTRGPVTINVHDADAAEAPSPAPPPPGEQVHVAEVAAWVDCYQRRDAVEEALTLAGAPADGYLVVESVVDDYGTTAHAGPRTWPDGTRSPGVLTVALIHRPAGKADADWIHAWHEVQSPASGRLQPRTRYVRNQVVRPLRAGAPEVDGIVEEAWPSAEHVADPMLFFNAGGDADRLQANVAEMMVNVEACLDLTRLRSTTMGEHLLRT